MVEILGGKKCLFHLVTGMTLVIQDQSFFLLTWKAEETLLYLTRHNLLIEPFLLFNLCLTRKIPQRSVLEE